MMGGVGAEEVHEVTLMEVNAAAVEKEEGGAECDMDDPFATAAEKVVEEAEGSGDGGVLSAGAILGSGAGAAAAAPPLPPQDGELQRCVAYYAILHRTRPNS